MESAPEDYDIVKRGFLHIKRPPSNNKIRLKAWQKKYLILHDDSYERVRRLEIYPDDSSVRQNEAEKHVIDLSKAVSVTDYNESKTFPHAFTLSLKGAPPVLLAGDMYSESRKWKLAIGLLINKTGNRITQTESCLEHRTSHLCLDEVRGGTTCPALPQSTTVRHHQANDNIYHELQPGEVVQRIYPNGYPVHVQPTSASERNNLRGEYTMLVKNAHVLLRSSGAQYDVMVWPILHVLKFKTEDSANGRMNLVSLVAGINSLKHGGEFQFHTKHGQDLVKMVKEAMKEDRGSDESVNRQSERIPPLRNVTSQRRPETRSPKPNNVCERAHSLSCMPALPERSPRTVAFRKTSAPADHTSARRRKDSGFVDAAEMSSSNNDQTVATRRESGFHDYEEIPPPPPPRPQHTLTHHSLPVKRSASE